VALTVGTTLLIKSGRLRWAWVTGVPLAFDLAVTLTASWHKIFSGDPRIGFFAQRDRFQEALGAGEVLAPAKTLDDMHQVVVNSTVDGVLSVIFAALIIIVVADASRVWIRAIGARGAPLTTAEAPHVRSRIVAPAGLWPNAAERALARAAAPGPEAQGVP
jgi:carbon starvation protein